MAESPNPSWRYGVALFPFAPLLSLIALGSLRAFISISVAESLTETGVLVGLATFFLGVLSGWFAVLVAVAVSVFLDARAFAPHPTWSPNHYVFGSVGLVHLAGTQLQVLYFLSVPSLLYYVYQRRQHVS